MYILADKPADKCFVVLIKYEEKFFLASGRRSPKVACYTGTEQLVRTRRHEKEIRKKKIACAPPCVERRRARRRRDLEKIRLDDRVQAGSRRRLLLPEPGAVRAAGGWRKRRLPRRGHDAVVGRRRASAVSALGFC